jgi:hypothetical protein
MFKSSAVNGKTLNDKSEDVVVSDSQRAFDCLKFLETFQNAILSSEKSGLKKFFPDLVAFQLYLDQSMVVYGQVAEIQERYKDAYCGDCAIGDARLAGAEPASEPKTTTDSAIVDTDVMKDADAGINVDDDDDEIIDVDTLPLVKNLDRVDSDNDCGGQGGNNGGIRVVAGGCGGYWNFREPVTTVHPEPISSVPQPGVSNANDADKAVVPYGRRPGTRGFTGTTSKPTDAHPTDAIQPVSITSISTTSTTSETSDASSVDDEGDEEEQSSQSDTDEQEMAVTQKNSNGGARSTRQRKRSRNTRDQGKTVEEEQAKATQQMKKKQQQKEEQKAELKKDLTKRLDQLKMGIAKLVKLQDMVQTLSYGGGLSATHFPIERVVLKFLNNGERGCIVPSWARDGKQFPVHKYLEFFKTMVPNFYTADPITETNNSDVEMIQQESSFNNFTNSSSSSNNSSGTLSLRSSSSTSSQYFGKESCDEFNFLKESLLGAANMVFRALLYLRWFLRLHNDQQALASSGVSTTWQRIEMVERDYCTCLSLDYNSSYRHTLILQMLFLADCLNWASEILPEFCRNHCALFKALSHMHLTTYPSQEIVVNVLRYDYPQHMATHPNVKVSSALLLDLFNARTKASKRIE